MNDIGLLCCKSTIIFLFSQRFLVELYVNECLVFGLLVRRLLRTFAPLILLISQKSFSPLTELPLDEKNTTPFVGLFRLSSHPLADAVFRESHDEHR